jgi:hypothetical protein
MLESLRYRLSSQSKTIKVRITIRADKDVVQSIIEVLL